MKATSVLQNAPLDVAARAKNDEYRLTAEEAEVARANTDDVFEFACRFIAMKSWLGWIEEICTEQSQSFQRSQIQGRKLDARPAICPVPGLTGAARSPAGKRS
jgi:hypothetical protein